MFCRLNEAFTISITCTSKILRITGSRWLNLRPWSVQTWAISIAPQIPKVRTKCPKEDSKNEHKIFFLRNAAGFRDCPDPRVGRLLESSTSGHNCGGKEC